MSENSREGIYWELKFTESNEIELNKQWWISDNLYFPHEALSLVDLWEMFSFAAIFTFESQWKHFGKLTEWLRITLQLSSIENISLECRRHSIYGEKNFFIEMELGNRRFNLRSRRQCLHNAIKSRDANSTWCSFTVRTFPISFNMRHKLKTSW